MADAHPVKYATISYVWGPTFAASLRTRHLYDIDKVGQPIDDLAPLFSDALIVCSHLDIPYLWVDAYCINQLDEVEKSFYVDRMSEIYKQSVLTIVAVDAMSPAQSLPGVSKPRTHSLYWADAAMSSCVLTIVPGFTVHTSQWNSRAWTLQESLLSPCQLFFGSHIWSFYGLAECYREDFADATDKIVNETYTWDSIAKFEPEILSPLASKYRTASFKMIDYCEFVGLYRRRAMSDPRDSLNAAMGIINHWQETNDVGEFVHGLPTAALPSALMWYEVGYGHRGNQEIPTWSWAAWHGSVVYPIVCHERSRTQVEKDWKDYRAFLTQDNGSLHRNIAAWSQPGTINFGTVGEVQAKCQYSHLDGLSITSYFARTALHVATRQEHEQWKATFYLVNDAYVDEQGFSRNRPTLVMHEEVTTLEFGEDSHQKIHLADDVTDEEVAELKSHGADLIMLKYWYRLRRGGSEPPEPFRVWVLLVHRRNDSFFRRLGCTSLLPKFWQSLTPQVKKIHLL